jgi:DNA polymerase-3 subunit gamma/tau
MPAQALYLKYRPRAFEEIEGQTHVTHTLKNALVENRIAHAYLFAGPRGTGKTTTARILAKAVNCLGESGAKPDNSCANCVAINESRMLDLIEIDAASHTSVEDIRELRDKIDFRPGEAKYKVYIIDEVHMLSTSAFNALLKTLEEPPPHVIFVLATTDPQKIPATVISRVQRFDFRRLTLGEIIERLKEIAVKEELNIEPAALELVARQASGSMRDAISMLDQLTAYNRAGITLAQVQSLLGATPYELMGELSSRIIEQDVAGGLALIAQAVDGGADPRQFARDMVEYFRGILLIKNKGGNLLSLTAETHSAMDVRSKQMSVEQIMRTIRLFNQAAFELRASVNPTLPLEIALIESTLEESASLKSPPPRPIPAPAPKRSPEIQDAKKNSMAPSAAPGKESDSIPGSGSEAFTLENLRAEWDRMLAHVRSRNKMAEALLRAAEPIKIEDQQITLGFRYEGHAERFEKQAKGKVLIEKAIEEIFKQPYRVKCVLSPQKAKVKAVESDPLIHAAVSQLGAEITEIHDQESS